MGDSPRCDGLQFSPDLAAGIAELRTAAGVTIAETEGDAAAAAGRAQIARALDLSPHTVKRHVANILEKLDISSRTQAADWYRVNRPMAR